MRIAFDYLAKHGGQAPGPNGRRYSDLASAEAWDLCRCLAKSVREGAYRPGPERVTWIEKSSGSGKRPIVVSNIEDRVIQRAMVEIIQPFLEPLFEPSSFGYRPNLSHLHALAHAEHVTLKQKRVVWLAEDIRDAFSHVPINPLLEVVRYYLPADNLIDLLARILPTANHRGLRQGGCLSPLLLNLYLHHHLDRPWKQRCPRLPLIRVADDLLILCKTECRANEAYEELCQILLPHGMPLKGSREESVVNLASGHIVSWLGFKIGKPSRGLAYTMAARAYRSLQAHLELAHTKSHAPLRAIQTIKLWLSQKGPAYKSSDREGIANWIIARAHQLGFEEVPGSKKLIQFWQRAHARWVKLRRSMTTVTQTSHVPPTDR